MAEKAIKLKAKVEKIHSTELYDIRILDNDMVIKGHISGKMRNFRIRILPGDIVDVEINPVDPTRGRITYRHKIEKRQDES
ncbi:translation initiation factor IF-1 [Mycoplasma testudineum]|uniref:Translation initiation factor IF-1 n=1 Tax=Mycoplasma testudineum TaxID=244584 RepID=A0A4R6IFF7_9MOLU|nr:translation initiation factor IF-1 [Mycoplasma testudineum]OYD27162.1 translation initiation factor IF-1 [Mycoplasma testudineum]TDO21080.1 translation initiation factor IF-1 [Mycoplasma testudineum]